MKKTSVFIKSNSSSSSQHLSKLNLVDALNFDKSLNMKPQNEVSEKSDSFRSTISFIDELSQDLKKVHPIVLLLYPWLAFSHVQILGHHLVIQQSAEQ